MAETAPLPAWMGDVDPSQIGFPLPLDRDAYRKQSGIEYKRTPDGREFAFRGVYREISPARTVSTFVFEGMPDHEAVITIELEERDGKTIMTETMVHDSVASRDGHLASGMERGANESMERLEEVLTGMGAAGAMDRQVVAG